MVLTLDNMGEAADLERNLWPDSSTPVGHHYSVTEILPHFLAILAKHDVCVTYFIESWNLAVYPSTIREIISAGHEIGWHAWRHEAWSKIGSEEQERANFARSFGGEGLRGFVNNSKPGEAIIDSYKGFRPPSGMIYGQRTLGICKEYGLKYISPAGQNAAVVPLQNNQDSMVILPFRWTTVDAFYYMETFSKLREMKGESEKPQSEQSLTQKIIAQIDEGIVRGGYLSILFHPFLSNSPERLQAFETVVAYLA
ncbi:uncharacterized protein RCC_09093 [Ramularia collo-cygni]|uniref:chitin deacetylase n=1 Tax=Ramularia collo-cygni TaxID=112498 RepID=A0A2D3VJA8_9PEZI|nr:uncharacterized protein RCC_09093 [Ramularia collo-cygni]CZT23379.1 uncharacterized protein RCC_09093 [Ramularia collo-cygni]